METDFKMPNSYQLIYSVEFGDCQRTENLLDWGIAQLDKNAKDDFIQRILILIKEKNDLEMWSDVKIF